MKPELTRRKILGGVASLGILGAGVTAQTGLDGASISGSADVQAEQALTIPDVTITGGDTDASFDRISDDQTEYQVAVELNNGDSFTVDHDIDNGSQSTFAVQFNIEASDSLTVTSDDLVRAGSNTFLGKVTASGETDVSFRVDLADTADPGSFDVSVAINPLSTEKDSINVTDPNNNTINRTNDS
jgi:hypothetical protein